MLPAGAFIGLFLLYEGEAIGRSALELVRIVCGVNFARPPVREGGNRGITLQPLKPVGTRLVA